MTDVSGTPRHRREDPALLTGSARFTDDLSDPGLLHMAVLRSQYGHARIQGVDRSRAEALDRVVGVYTAADLTDAGMSTARTAGGPLPGQEPVEVSMLADEVVRHAGEGIAIVLAEDRYVAHDALDRIDVEYERLDAVVEPEAALEPDAPIVHEERTDNLAFEHEVGDAEAVDDAFARAAHTVTLEVDNQRVLANPIEPRSAYADYDPSTGELEVRFSTQAAHRDRDAVAETLSIPTEQVHVKAPAVGGAFGVKVYSYEDEILTAWCSMQHGRPVKWASTRSEGHNADHHGRGIRSRGELALSDDGEFLGYRVNAVIGVGAYHHRAFIPVLSFGTLLSGQYDIPAIHGAFTGAFTNTSPIGPYRGAGRPESVLTLERVVDQAATELGLDPVEIRRRNQIPSEAFPFETAHGEVYDSGDYATALDLALDLVDYEHWRTEQRRRRDEGRYLGIGVSCFVENTGSPGRPEWGRVELDASGSVTAYAGTADGGQGHDTTFSQLLADRLGVPFEDVRFRDGDSDSTPDGKGTSASRSVVVGGTAIAESADEIVEQARGLAAEHFEAAEEDITFAGGEFAVTGTDRSIGIQELVASHAAPDQGDGSSALTATTRYEPGDNAYAFGTHIVVVEVDPTSGEIAFNRYVAVDDCGVQLNPMLVEGQVHGGVGQGIGQALFEHASYDDSGTLVAGSLQDYAMPRAMNTPELEVDETETPSPTNPLGAKGAGESGTLAAPPAVVNAVVDALRPLGVEHLDMPLTAETVWQAVDRAEQIRAS